MCVRGVCESCPKDQELFGDKATPLDLGLPELCTVSPGQDPESGPDPFLEAPGGVGVVRPSPNTGGTLWPQGPALWGRSPCKTPSPLGDSGRPGPQDPT